MGSEATNVGRVSDDGKWIWNGSEWRPKPPSMKSPSRVPAPVRRIGGIIAIGVVGLGIAYAQGANESDQAPKVGECARLVGEDDIEKVPCSDERASLRVTSRHENTSDGDAACAADATATSYFSYELESHGSTVTSFLLCLEDL